MSASYWSWLDSLHHFTTINSSVDSTLWIGRWSEGWFVRRCWRTLASLSTVLLGRLGCSSCRAFGGWLTYLWRAWDTWCHSGSLKGLSGFWGVRDSGFDFALVVAGPRGIRDAERKTHRWGSWGCLARWGAGWLLSCQFSHLLRSTCRFPFWSCLCSFEHAYGCWPLSLCQRSDCTWQTGIFHYL
jgi:hypothetical protein